MLIYDDRGQWRALDARYFRAGGALFVDTSARELPHEPPSESYWSLHRVPFHLLTRVEVSDGRVRARTLIAGKPFEEAAGNMPLAKRGDYSWFAFRTAPAEWMKFLEKHARNDALFSKEMVFERLKQ